MDWCEGKMAISGLAMIIVPAAVQHLFQTVAAAPTGAGSSGGFGEGVGIGGARPSIMGPGINSGSSHSGAAGCPGLGDPRGGACGGATRGSGRRDRATVP